MSGHHETCTPNGVPIRLCDQCGIEHPITRQHCADCGRPTLFLTAGRCARGCPGGWLARKGVA